MCVLIATNAWLSQPRGKFSSQSWHYLFFLLYPLPITPKSTPTFLPLGPTHSIGSSAVVVVATLPPLAFAPNTHRQSRPSSRLYQHSSAMVTITDKDDTTDTETTDTSGSSSPISSSSSSPPPTKDGSEEGYAEGGGTNTVDKGKAVERGSAASQHITTPPHVTSGVTREHRTPDRTQRGRHSLASTMTPPKLGESTSTSPNTSDDTPQPPTKGSAPHTPDKIMPRARQPRRRTKARATGSNSPSPSASSSDAQGSGTFGEYVAKASSASSEEWSYGDRGECHAAGQLTLAFRLMPRRASAQLKMRARGGSPESSPSPESWSTNAASREGTPSPDDSVDGSSQVADRLESNSRSEARNATAFSDHAPTAKSERKDMAAKQKLIYGTPTSANAGHSVTAPAASGSTSSLSARIALGVPGERSPERKLSGYGILPDGESDTESLEDGDAGVQKSAVACLNPGAADSLAADLESCSIDSVIEGRGSPSPAAAELDMNELVHRMATLEHKVDALTTENEDLKRSVAHLSSQAEPARAR